MPFELFEPRAAGTPFDEASERATWRAVRPANPGSVRRTAHGEGHGDPRTEAREASLDASLDPGSSLDDGRADRSDGERADPRGGRDPGAEDPQRRSPEADARGSRGGPFGSKDRSPTPRHGGPRDGGSHRAAADDFSSPNERNRFRRLAPIRRQDVARTDLEELIRRLSG
jgi:hypothetical protein